ncbi:Hypothetical protein NGAL_HAMBI2605_10320 [Neorhizobium galegae bv. orientalis]|nr:Hypothetical protein NGAL_HAMBI2605_10320 [Neorhizobium galegae bv. orientalis]
MKPDLETRIADAFDAQLSAKQLTELIAEVGRADADAKAASEKASEAALDPATRPDAVAQARKDMEDANFRRLRMERATAKLGEMKSDAVARENLEEAQRERAAATAERDQLAKDLAEYEQLSQTITNLLVRLRASNARIGDFNSAEIIARGAGAQWAVQVDETLPKLLEAVRLPKFKRDGSNRGYLWPQQ